MSGLSFAHVVTVYECRGCGQRWTEACDIDGSDTQTNAAVTSCPACHSSRVESYVRAFGPMDVLAIWEEVSCGKDNAIGQSNRQR